MFNLLMADPHSDIFEYYKEEFKEIFSLNSDKIENLIKEYNSTKGIIIKSKFSSLDYIADLVNSIGIQRGLSTLIHQYSKHEDSFKEILQKSFLNPSQKINIEKFVQGLNKDAIEGINFTYECDVSEMAEKNLLLGINDEILFKRISDHDDKTLGVLPLVKLNLGLSNGDDKFEQSITMGLASLKFMAQALSEIYENNVNYVKEHKNKFDERILEE